MILSTESIDTHKPYQYGHNSHMTNWPYHGNGHNLLWHMAIMEQLEYALCMSMELAYKNLHIQWKETSYKASIWSI